MDKKLYRDEHHRVIGGVCSGLAQYFEMDPTIVRLLFAFTFFLMGVGLGTYIVLWIVLPRKDYPFNAFNNPTVDYTVPPQQSSARFNTPPPPRADNPFGGNPLYTPPKQKSNAGLIFGMILIFIGGVILIEEFDLIPDVDFGNLWPVIFLIIGGALIASGQRKEPWESPNFSGADKRDNSLNDNPPAAEDTEADDTITKKS